MSSRIISCLLAVECHDIYFGMVVPKPCCQTFCAEDGTVLPAGASESDAEVCEVTFIVFFNALLHNSLYMFEEFVDSGLALHELNYWTIFARVAFVLWIAAGIGQRSTIEDVTAAIATIVGGKPLLIAETLYSDSEGIEVGGRRLEVGVGC